MSKLKPIAICEVITETGELLGRVRNFQVQRRNWYTLLSDCASLGIPQIPDQVLRVPMSYQLKKSLAVAQIEVIVFEGRRTNKVVNCGTAGANWHW